MRLILYLAHTCLVSYFLPTPSLPACRKITRCGEAPISAPSLSLSLSFARPSEMGQHRAREESGSIRETSKGEGSNGLYLCTYIVNSQLSLPLSSIHTLPISFQLSWVLTQLYHTVILITDLHQYKLVHIYTHLH